MQDTETERIILKLCAKAVENPEFGRGLLDPERRKETLVERRKPKHVKFGISEPLFIALMNLPKFEKLEEFKDAADEIDIDYAKWRERK